MPEAKSDIKVIHPIAETLMVVPLAPSCPQGEIDESPKPAPRITRINDRPAAPAAPARIAPQETPLALLADTSAALVSRVSSVDICILISCPYTWLMGFVLILNIGSALTNICTFTHTWHLSSNKSENKFKFLRFADFFN